MYTRWLWMLLLCYFYLRESFAEGVPPKVVNIGAIFSLNTINGKVSEIAMKAAVDHVNSDPNILNGTKLVLSVHNSNQNGFLGIIGGLRYMETNTVAVIGPQTSEMARTLSQLASELQIPMLSFTALDPSLSSLQHPFFVQTSPNDLFQMTAIADIISYFGYREVVAIYTDDDERRGGITVLGEKLAERRCKISYKAALSPRALATRDEITNELVKVSLLESRVIIVDAFQVVGKKIFDCARTLRMIEKGYVWIATTWLSSAIDSRRVSREDAKSVQGVITLRPHTPDSDAKRKFLSRWDELSDRSIMPNAYGLYAYDTVITIARAVKEFTSQGGVISFSNNTKLNDVLGGPMNLGALTTFDEGKKLLEHILSTNRTGLTGKIAFDENKFVVNPAFDVINVIGNGYKQIGYWTNYSGLSVIPPETLYTKPANRSSSNQRLHNLMWPGKTSVKPRGWVFPNSGRRLRIGVPDRVAFKDFVSKDENSNDIHGYSIDVFLAAVNLLPYAVPHEFVLFGDKRKNPTYTKLINMIPTNEFDAVVGDIAIVTNRMKIVDFTQPYIESGLVVVVPMRKQNSSPWAFMRPFTLSMWAVTGLFFFIVGGVIWILEHRSNDEFRGPPKKQLITVLWFGLSTMFFAHRENTVSTLGRIVLIIWLFVVLIITSSYTASLTSMLTVQQLAPSIRGIESLITSNDRIGYQEGSFSRNYLAEELNIARSRLVALNSPEEYADALTKRRVAAIVDERPYVDMFLSKYCMFQAVGQEFTRSGWGFAFPKDSPLAMDMSTAILTLSENGELQKIHDKWLTQRACLSSTSVDSEQLQLKSFWGLFLITGITCFIALLIYFFAILYKFQRYYRHQSDQPPSRNSSSRSVKIQRFLSFVDDKEEESKNKLKRKQVEFVSRDHATGSSTSKRNEAEIYPE